MSKLNRVKNALKKVTRQDLDINVLNENRFTFFFDGKNEQAVQKLKDFFKGQLILTGGYDEEADFTCLLGVKY